MSSSESDPPLLLSLKPRAPPTDPATQVDPIAGKIAQLQREQGHFRELTEEIVLARLASAEEHSSSSPSADSPSQPAQPSSPPATPPADDPTAPSTTTTPAIPPKYELLGHVAAAAEDALLMLDFISLLGTIHNNEAESSMSPALKQVLPISCLGFDRISRKPAPQQFTEDAKVAREWKRKSIKKTAEMLTSASKATMTRVEKEERYYEEVMKIRQEGWAIARMPREKGVLGVRYGFPEAGDMFRGKGLGALRMGAEGAAVMDDPAVTGAHGDRLLRVRIMKSGEVLGESVQKERLAGSTVKEQIERARDFVYDDELFFEINREARQLASAEVRTEENVVIIGLIDGREIVLDMKPLNSSSDESQQSSQTTLPDSSTAQKILLGLRTLLTHSHTETRIRRAQAPPPLAAKKPPPQPLFLLRPLITHIFHRTIISNLTRFLTRLTTSLAHAGLHSKFKLSPYANFTTPVTDTSSAVSPWLREIISTAKVELPGGVEVSIVIKSLVSNPRMVEIRVSETSTSAPTTTGSGAPAAAAAASSVANAPGGPQQRSLGSMVQEFRNAVAAERHVQYITARAVVREVVGWGEGWEPEMVGNEVLRTEGAKVKRVRVGAWDGEGLSATIGGEGETDERTVWGEGEQNVSLRELLNKKGE